MLDFDCPVMDVGCFTSEQACQNGFENQFTETIWIEEPIIEIEPVVEPVICTKIYIDCSSRGGYDPSDPCQHTCMDDLPQ